MAAVRRFGRDRSGSAAVLTVLMLGVLFAVAAITVDASRFYLDKRRQQTVNDLAAVAAAANLGNARAAAVANLAANGIAPAALAAIEVGTYVADPGVAAARRFTAGGASPNAARVTLSAPTSAAFGALFGTASATVGTRSVAVNADVAAFALGSTLASLDGGLLNAILGSLTGSSLSLSAVDYAGLAGAGVDLFGVANALAVRIGATGTYASLAATTVRVSDVINAAADAGSAAGLPGSTVSALRAVAAAIGPSSPTFRFGALVGFGAYGSLSVGSAPPAAAALPALALVSAAARLGRGATMASASLGSSGGAIRGATVRIAFAPTAGASFAAIGPVGLTLRTARTRVSLALQLAGSGTITGLNLPLTVEVAPATATLSAVGCSAGAAVDPAATLGVTPGAVDGWIGTVTDAALTDAANAPSFAAAPLTDVGLLSVWGRAHATVSNTAATPVPFTRAEIAAGTAKRTATTDYTASLLTALIRDLQLSATLLGLPLSVPSGTASAITGLLQADLAAIDGALSNVLGTLGVTVGDADTWVRAVRCGQGALVN